MTTIKTKTDYDAACALARKEAKTEIIRLEATGLVDGDEFDRIDVYVDAYDRHGVGPWHQPREYYPN